MCCFISRDGREWHTSNTPSEHSGYRSMGHPVNVPSHHMIDPYGGGYHATGHPSDVPIQHMNDAYPPSSHYDDPFMSGHPNHDPNSYPSSRDPEIGYPHSGRPFNRHSSLEHPSNAPGSDLSQLNDIHWQNGFADEVCFCSSYIHHTMFTQFLLMFLSKFYSCLRDTYNLLHLRLFIRHLPITPTGLLLLGKIHLFSHV